MPHSSCYLTSIMDKTYHGQFLPFFLCNFSSFFSYVGGNVSKHFSLLFIDRCILPIPQIITHKEFLRYSFWSAAIFWTSSEAHGHNNRNWVKQPQSHFYCAVPRKSPHFLLFWWTVLMYALYGQPRYFNLKWKYQQCGPCFQTFRFLWLW